MLSVVYITNRGLYPLVDKDELNVSQYDLLASSLKVQTIPLEQLELVVVDQVNPLPREELNFLGDRVRYVRPRDTPWRRAGAFAPASARNSGLLATTGETVLGLDDCVTFGPDLLRGVHDHAQRGEYMALEYVAKSDAQVPGKLREVKQCGGLVAYPREVALATGMHDERFDGAEAYEDIEFSERLQLAGVRFFMDGRLRVVLHRHERMKRKLAKCAILAYHLVKGGTVANVPWTSKQIDLLCRPCKFLAGRKCHITMDRCRSRAASTKAGVETISEYESKSWDFKRNF
jgi:hypothetical protein